MPAAITFASPLNTRISSPGSSMAAAQKAAEYSTVSDTLKRMERRTRLYSPRTVIVADDWLRAVVQALIGMVNTSRRELIMVITPTYRSPP